MTDASIDLAPGIYNPLTGNANGVYPCLCLTPNTYVLTVSAPGRLNATRGVDLSESKMLSIAFPLWPGSGGEGEGEGNEGEGDPILDCYQAAAGGEGETGSKRAGGDAVLLVLMASILVCKRNRAGPK